MKNKLFLIGPFIFSILFIIGGLSINICYADTLGYSDTTGGSWGLLTAYFRADSIQAPNTNATDSGFCYADLDGSEGDSVVLVMAVFKSSDSSFVDSTYHISLKTFDPLILGFEFVGKVSLETDTNYVAAIIDIAGVYTNVYLKKPSDATGQYWVGNTPSGVPSKLNPDIGHNITGYFSIWITTSGGTPPDETPPDLHDSFDINKWVSVGTIDLANITIGSVDSTDYDSTIIRYGTTIPSSITDGSLLWTGGVRENNTSDYSLAADSGMIYFKIFAGDTIPNWNVGVADSLFMPGVPVSAIKQNRMFEIMMNFNRSW